MLNITCFERHGLTCTLELQASLNICIALSSKEPTWAPQQKSAVLKLRVDHDYAVGGERPEGKELRDRPFTVSCLAVHTSNSR